MLTKWVYKVGRWVVGLILCLHVLAFSIYALRWITEHGDWTFGNILGFCFAFIGAASGFIGGFICIVSGGQEITKR